MSTKPKKKDAVAIDRLPLLPLKDVVVFPRMVLPLFVGRAASLAAVDESLASERPLFLCTQRDASVESPVVDDLYGVGVAANILQTLRMPDGTMKVVIEGMGRGTLHELHPGDSYVEASVSPLEERSTEDEETQGLMRTSLSQFENYTRLSQRVAPEVVVSLRSMSDPCALADLICAYLSTKPDERQNLLEEVDVKKRLDALSSILMRENHLLEIEQRVRDRVREQMERGQREYYLHEQLKAIRQELGQREEGGDEFAELRELIKKARMPKEVRHKAERELERYERMPALSPEAAVTRTYLDWLIEMPWQKRTRDAIDLERAKQVLDEDHYGLTKVKERILEFLAVRKLSKSTKGPVLCLVGAPGVGKTSLGKSVARAMSRKFVRVSLGGIRDEAEIRGHRRTYIGSLPGRIIQSIKKCGVKNPVFMLDEIDKMNMDFRGDPSSALLEVLDPEQNTNFSDHYLEVDYDLHEVFFITTANSEFEIPDPLHDRMEVVRLSGYTALEKEKIAELFLIPKQMKESGLTDANIQFSSGGIQAIIQRYTREAGVRELERRIAAVCRKVARKVVGDKKHQRVVVEEGNLSDLLGPEEYTGLRAEAKAQVGLAVGLAWTSSGGDILNIETTTMKGKGGLTLTGQLGEVMQESAQAAYTFLRARAKELKIPTEFFKNMDIHIHVPEGAIPKDGPSAGISIAISMLSALRKTPPRAFVAMTGEITLRGRVLTVGGIKEKVLAAHRSGIRTIIMPRENEKDLGEIPGEVKDEVEFVLVERAEEAFDAAFDKPSKRAPRKRAVRSRADKGAAKRKAK
jgi:ATP-dependent Lon protease